ncbi:MAG TPA: ribonuclease III [Phycisphaerales bacterium]|nr:ribonuclease III [Phycisphaerales bacterium]HMP35927.1 ribonuclease III [Phycisphaerales bacterium]
MNDVTLFEQAFEALGYRFRDVRHLETSLLHASMAGTRVESNERLEFLGDAVLGLVVCEALFRRFPHLMEGELTKIKSGVVSRRVCAEMAHEMGLPELLRLGKGMNGRWDFPMSVAAAVFESVIGAIFLDGGIEPAREFILRSVGPKIDQAVRLGHQYNFKSVLQQTLQRIGMHAPQYLVLDEKGPDHAKCFEVCVESGARRFEPCWGPSKKEAEQQAALAALIELGAAEMDPGGDVRLRRGEVPATVAG